MVILGGYVASQFADHLACTIGQRIKTDVYESELRDIEIIPAQAGKNALIMDVANAVLQDAALP